MYHRTTALLFLCATLGTLCQSPIATAQDANATRQLAQLYWYGVPQDADRQGLARHWQRRSVGVHYCDDDIASCLERASGGYVVLRGTKSVLLGDVFKNPSTDDLKGVVVLGTRADMPKRARPTTTRPRLLTLVQRSAPGDSVVRVRRLTSSLRNKGIDASLLFVPPGAFDDLVMPPIATDILRRFLGATLRNAEFAELLAGHFNWQNPRWNNDEFRSQFKYLTTIPANKRTKSLFQFFFRREPYLLKQWSFERYTAFDLMAYRNAVAPGARYIKFANRRGQYYFMDLDRYAQYEPVIIVGVDDESNMYRFVWFYKTLKEYSWKDDVQNVSVRALGPALHFRKAPPEAMAVPLLLRSAIPLKGIGFFHEDPLVEIAPLPQPLQRIITQENKCIYCHAIGSVRPRAHHLDAMTLKPQGGFALPLSEYSDQVIQAFLYDQKRVADAIGMSPNYVDPDHIDEFRDWVRAQ